MRSDALTPPLTRLAIALINPVNDRNPRYQAEHLEHGCEFHGASSRSAVQNKSIPVKSLTIAVELTLAPKH
jgi:hypothetical protein